MKKKANAPKHVLLELRRHCPGPKAPLILCWVTAPLVWSLVANGTAYRNRPCVHLDGGLRGGATVVTVYKGHTFQRIMIMDARVAM